jgi:hypothetical protein
MTVIGARFKDDGSLARRVVTRRKAAIVTVVMGVAEIIYEIETLPAEERWKVLEHTRQLLEGEIPESFKLAMAEIKRGEVIELDESLKELDSAE